MMMIIDDDDDDDDLTGVIATGLRQFLCTADNESAGTGCLPRVSDGNGYTGETVGQTAASHASAVFTTDQSVGVL